jgi:diadenosine tetraphosphate (Ap4A) HIT family hydrolase
MTQVDLNKKTAEWRTTETHERYMEVLKSREVYDGCRLCDETVIIEFNLWKIINNEFPYDKIASTHHMIIPKRHTNGDDLTEEELNELTTLKAGYLNEQYHMLAEALPKRKTMPSHFHLHLFIPYP